MALYPPIRVFDCKEAIFTLVNCSFCNGFFFFICEDFSGKRIVNYTMKRRKKTGQYGLIDQSHGLYNTIKFCN